jgi:hypothetical protein
MHGDIECRGNIQQLCVQHILDPRRSKSGSPRAEFDMEQEDDGGVIPTNPEGITLNPIFPGMSFVSAQNYYDPRKIGQEEYAISSLKSIGYSWTESGVADCVEGEQGKELLLASVVRSRDELKQSKSCTILVGGKKRCVHDGGWYDCDVSHRGPGRDGVTPNWGERQVDPYFGFSCIGWTRGIRFRQDDRGRMGEFTAGGLK